MQFHDEIEKLQARVKALEDKFATTQPPTDEPDPEPQAYTKEYLDSLSVDELGDVYKAGHIDEAQLGAAVMRKVFPSGVPEEFSDVTAVQHAAEPSTGEVLYQALATEPAPEAAAAEVVEPVAEAAAETIEPEPVAEAEASAPVAEDAGLES